MLADLPLELVDHIARFRFRRLKRDVNCFVEHLELRAREIDNGGCLMLKELRILLVDTRIPASYLVDCKQLVAFHFEGAQPEIAHPESLKHISFNRMSPEQFYEL